MKLALLAATAIIAAAPALGANITAFSQTSGSNTVVATTDAGNTQTTLTITDALLSIGQFLTNPALPPAEFSLSATSVDAAVTILGAVIQHYDGTFCITSGPGCTGTNLLSGSFSDAAFGGLGGPGLVVNVNNPPDTLTLTSDILSATLLNPPAAFSLGFTDLTPVLAIVGTTIAPFSASFAGTVSAQAVPIPEPTSLGLLGLGLLGLTLVRARSKNAR